MFCKKCGEKIDDDSIFCRFCGVNQTIDTSSKSASGESEQVNIIPEEQEQQTLEKKMELSEEKVKKEAENDSELRIQPKPPQKTSIKNNPQYERTTENSEIIIVGILSIIAIWILFLGMRQEWFDKETLVPIQIIFLLVRIAFVIWIVNVADKLYRNPWLWGILGFFFTGIVMVIIGLLPKSLNSKQHKKRCYYSGGNALINGDYAEAIRCYKKCIDLGLHSNKMYIYYNLACAYSSINDIKKANESLILAFKNGYYNYTRIMKDKQIANLVNSDIFKETKKAYFPNQVLD